jgi:5'-nucleotidase
MASQYDYARLVPTLCQTETNQLRILVTNDDGVHAPGLWAVAEALNEVGEVFVVAPDRDLSGMGTAVSLRTPIRVREVPASVPGITTFAVEGTPGDCVILATQRLVPQPIDLVVSGINDGSNMGRDVMVSGTVGGALQGWYHDIPSIALSVASLSHVRYDAAAKTGAALATAIGRASKGTPLLLNVNLPNVEAVDIRGVEVTRLGPRAYRETVEPGSDRRNTYYWIRFDRASTDGIPEGTDVWAIGDDRISITALNPVTGAGESTTLLQDLADQVAAALGLTDGPPAPP